MLRLRQFFHDKKLYFIMFFVPVIIMIICYAIIGIYPGSKLTVMASDSFSQFSNFHASFRRVLLEGDSLFYTWYSALGLNYWALISYYLGGIFTPLVLLVPNHLMPDTLYFLTLLKIGCASISFGYFTQKTFRLSDASHLFLAFSYSLMSFIIGQSELIMWLDAFVWLPLIFTGIHQVTKTGKSPLLFWSYLILFISNFYFGFMIGLFSFLYFCLLTWSDWERRKKYILDYFVTAFSAGIASMIMILPTVFDLKNNGDELSKLHWGKTEATQLFDLFAKQLIGIYDTTKYGSIPFTYVGLLPFLVVIIFLVQPKVNKRVKISAILLLTLLMTSFYWEPLNLMWQGFHSPNMFLFRYSFLFSFTLLLITAYTLEHLERETLNLLPFLSVAFIPIIGLLYMTVFKTDYPYIKWYHVVITAVFYLIYAVCLYSYANTAHDTHAKKKWTLVTLAIIVIELSLNSFFMTQGILADWNYPSRSLYSEPYKKTAESVARIKKRQGSEFYRMEQMTPVSANDSLNHGYPGLSQFSSIRNTRSAEILNLLGFRSRGAHANTRYQNNTLLMDSLFGVKYNLTNDTLSKYQFDLVDHVDSMSTYQNQRALNLGLLTDNQIHTFQLPENNPLLAQETLLNQLASTEEHYFSYQYPLPTQLDNATITYENRKWQIKEKQTNIGKTLFFTITVPANKQAYFNLSPSDFNQIKSSSATILVNGRKVKSQISTTGLFYDLGYYDEETVVSFSIEFFGTPAITIWTPYIVLLDIPSFERTWDKLSQQQVAFEMGKRSVTASFTSDKKQTLWTTIPYDKGWRAFINEKEVDIKPFQDGFITIPVEKGKQTLNLIFFPQGLKTGIFLFFVGISSYYIFLYRQKNRK